MSNGYEDFEDLIKGLKKNGHLDEAAEALTGKVEEEETESRKTGEGVAPGYYDQLAKVYRKLKNREAETETLKRYLSQIKAIGSSPAAIYARYLKVNEGIDEKTLQEEIYKSYLSNIKSMNFDTVTRKCDECGKKGEYPIPRTVKELDLGGFGACCPYCCISSVIGLTQK